MAEIGHGIESISDLKAQNIFGECDQSFSDTTDPAVCEFATSVRGGYEDRSLDRFEDWWIEKVAVLIERIFTIFRFWGVFEELIPEFLVELPALDGRKDATHAVPNENGAVKFVAAFVIMAFIEFKQGLAEFGS